jgi:histidine phosphatase superfamily protein (branch 1)
MRLVRRPFALVSLVAAGLTLASTSCDVFNLISFTNSPPGTTTTLILIRHAERDPGADPPLNAEGQARAQVLKEVLSEHGVTAIFSPELIRNMQTVEPIAAHLGIEIKHWNNASYASTAVFAAAVADDILANYAGQTVLFVGNVGSTMLGTTGINDELYKRFGGTGTAPNRYQDMYIFIIPDNGPTRIIKTIYGPKSSLDPA